ncbi:hypothetical protein [Deinococcus yunweiensis]|uniref:hypothetical protein n=1 Tax=Deinococcus yunweiensis TaxID=367282 RepID=UPI00398F4F00
MINHDKGAPDAGIAVALTVPDGTLEGVPATYGAGGLLIIPLTKRVTAADLTNPALANPQGLRAGQASCLLLGVPLTIRATIDAAVAEGGKVYLQANGTYNGTNTGLFVGWKVNGKLALRANS